MIQGCLHCGHISAVHVGPNGACYERQCNCPCWIDGGKEAVGRKDDEGKDPWDLLSWPAIELVVRVLAAGAKIYGADNWRKVPNAKRRYFAAAIRHITKWWRGEWIDKDSGLPHLAHAICCLMFLLDIGMHQDPPGPQAP